MSLERRLSQRKACRRPVRCSLFGKRLGTTQDLSRWGASLECPVPLVAGTPIELCLKLRPGHRGLQIGGLVRWTKVGGNLAGIEFLSMSRRSRLELEQFLAT